MRMRTKSGKACPDNMPSIAHPCGPLTMLSYRSPFPGAK